MTNTNLHAIALVNIADGSVQGHKAGCADLSRGTLRRHADEVWNLEVSSKHEAWDAYNSDFIAECENPEGDCDHEHTHCSNAYDIDWKACAKHVPDFAEAPTTLASVTVETIQELVETPDEDVDVTVKVGRKWTYIYAPDGSLIAEVRNDHYAAVAAALQA